MKIGIVGCAGRMGRMLIKTVMARPDARLIGGTEPMGSDFSGHDLAALAGLEPCGIAVNDQTDILFEAADAVIDFTAPAATRHHGELAAKHKTALVVGTTGLTDDDQAQIITASRQTVIVQAANFSVGVNLLLGLTEQVAARLGDDYDLEILEMHHRHKVDAPSGTALALGEAAASGRRVDLNNVSVRVRDGQTGARRPGDIGFATLRGGGVVGDHTVMFASDAERLELTHKAQSRDVFASGAVRAAVWSKDQPPGLYSMRDVLV